MMIATQYSGRVDDRDWSKLTLGKRSYQLEGASYLVLPALLKGETGQLNTCADPYQRYTAHSEERMVTARAGSPRLINHKVLGERTV